MFRNINAITFKIGTFCNLNCEYCFQKYDVKADSHTFEMANTLLKFLQNPKLSLDNRLEFKITGGEPMLYKDKIREVWKILKKIERYRDTKIRFTTITNGSRMGDFIDLIDEGIFDPYGCKISWDGIHSASKSRKPKNEKYNDGFFSSKIDELGKSKYAKDVLVRIALTPNTIEDLFESFKYAYSVGCRKLEYYYLTDCEAYKDKEFQKKFKYQIEKIARFKVTNDFLWTNWETIEAMEILDSKDRFRAIACRHLGKFLYIEQNGDIAPCGFFSADSVFENTTFYIGNIYHGFYKDKVEEFIDKYFNIPMCYNKECSSYQCFECPATNMYRTGHMQNKLFQTCSLRSIEKSVFYIFKDSMTLGVKRTKKTYDYFNTWKIEKSIPDLPYCKKENGINE